MRRNLFLAAAIIAALALTSVAWAHGGEEKSRGGSSRPFIGLWQAIDSFDGSAQLLSITCSAQDDCDVRLNDTAFTLSCPDQIGFAQGIGVIVDGVLAVELTLQCSNLDGTSELAGSQENEFVLDRRNGTLVNLNDDPVPVSNVFHKISK